MKSKLITGLVLTLFLVGMLTFAFNVQPAKASGTIYIRADGSVEGTDKIQRDGDLYTFTDNIYGSIVVERDNIVVDGTGYTVQGPPPYGKLAGIELSGRSNITIRNMEIRAFFYGIFLVYYSNHNNIIGNKLTANNYDGIWLFDSSYNSIVGNNITNNWNGIRLQYSSFSNSISRNNITNSTDCGIALGGSNNTIFRNNITNNGYGIVVDSSNNNSIVGNNITVNNRGGILLGYSSNNTLRSNTMANNTYNFDVKGESLSHFVNDVDVSNTVDGKPVYYWINETDRAVPLDAGYVALINCTRLIVQNLNLTNNAQGILLAFATNSTIAKNNIANNWHGIGLYYSNNNKFYHNNLIDNIKQVYIPMSGYANFWDDDYPSGGNYWSDYAGVDFFSGPDQFQYGSDGIGDTPYTITLLTTIDHTLWTTIDPDNRDRYPLISLVDTIKPVANAGSDQTVYLGENVTFNASRSNDNFGIISYDWYFGDGTTGTGVITTHKYNKTGTFTVTLTVKDAEGNSDTDTITITVLSTLERFPLWVIGAVGGIVAAIAIGATILWKRKAKPSG